MNKLKKYTVLVMSFLLLSLPVLSVSAAAPEKTDEGYYYFVNLSGRRADYFEHYFTYNATAGGYSDNLLAALYDTTTFEYGTLNLYSITDGKVSLISRNASIPVLSYEVLADTGHADSDNFFKVGNNLYPSIIKGEWHGFGEKKLSSYQDITTNIPYFSTEEQVIHYLETGDLTGNQNPYDPMDDLEEDSTYALTGFSATSEGKTGNIEAKWTGTTHDKNSSDYESMEYHVSATYTTGEGDTGHGGGGGSRDEEGNQETITGGKQTEANILSGDISEKGFKKLYSFFKPPSGTYHLYSLKVLPTYTVDGKTVKGKPSYIYFDSDGNITKVVNEIHETQPELFDDSTFELKDVSVKNGPTAMLTGKLWHKISWSGTTKDNVLKNVSPDKTYISVFFYGSSEDGSRKLYDYEDVYTYLGTLRIFEVANNVNGYGNSFEFATEQAINACEADGLTFTGEVWLTPYYTVDNCIYKGKVTVVDVLNGKVGSIDPSDPEAPDKPVYPDDPDKPDNPDSPVINIPSIDSISDVIPFFLSILKSFISGVGQVPSLLAYLFPFLPSEIVYLLTFGFVASVILRVLGR